MRGPADKTGETQVGHTSTIKINGTTNQPSQAVA